MSQIKQWMDEHEKIAGEHFWEFLWNATPFDCAFSHEADYEDAFETGWRMALANPKEKWFKVDTQWGDIYYFVGSSENEIIKRLSTSWINYLKTNPIKSEHEKQEIWLNNRIKNVRDEISILAKEESELQLKLQNLKEKV